MGLKLSIVGVLGFVSLLNGLDIKVDPFAINNGAIPSEQEYKGSFFKFNYDYPLTYIKPETPWTNVLNGKPLTKKNSYQYIMALKAHVGKSMKTFVNEPQKWNQSSQKGWYSMLWAGENIKKTAWEGRDAIYGTYTGQILSKDVYKDSGLTVDIRNHAAIYYDKTAAFTLGQVWKKCDKSKKTCIPSVTNKEAQFKEGSIIIKSAGVTATPEQWPVLDGAAKWQVYRKPFNLNGTIENEKAKVTDIRVGIFDIIVKDSIASPETGWVFTTLVYDSSSFGKTAWDRMVPLGAMWGNDPDVNSAKYPTQELMETYINPNAPEWTKVTLGYGKRMSGPFDIAVKYNVEVDGKIVKSLRSSSCLSCHGTSSFMNNYEDMITFFYPAKEFHSQPWKMYKPGSIQWNEWFQNRAGDEAQSKQEGVIALDYSTFLEAVLMNYAASNNRISNEILSKWNKYRYLRKH